MKKIINFLKNIINSRQKKEEQEREVIEKIIKKIKESV